MTDKFPRKFARKNERLFRFRFSLENERYSQIRFNFNSLKISTRLINTHVPLFFDAFNFSIFEEGKKSSKRFSRFLSLSLCLSFSFSNTRVHLKNGRNKGGIDNGKKSRQKLKRRRQGNEGALSDKQWANYRVTGCFDPITVIIILVRGNTLSPRILPRIFQVVRRKLLGTALPSIFEPCFDTVVSKQNSTFYFSPLNNVQRWMKVYFDERENYRLRSLIFSSNCLIKNVWIILIIRSILREKVIFFFISVVPFFQIKK